MCLSYFSMICDKEVLIMNICYNNLFKLLIDKGMKKSDLKTAAGISSNTLAKLSSNEYVSMDVLVRICRVLHCKIEDIVEILPEEKTII